MRPSLRLGLTLLALTAAGGSVAASQLFKCVDGGRTVYQQQACSIAQADPSASAARPAPSKAGAASEPATRVARQLKPSSPTPSSAPSAPR